MLSSRHSKGPDPCHDIRHDLARLEHVDDTLVLCAELRVPVDLGVVKLKGAVGLADLDMHVVRAGEDFVGECAILILVAYVVQLVDHCPQVGILVENDFRYDPLVWQVLFSEIEMS